MSERDLTHGTPELEIPELVRRLHETQERLIALTGGGVDAVVHPDGSAYLLHDAQEHLRSREELHRSLADRQTAILNALPAHIALIDAEGSIVAINERWREFAGQNGLEDPAGVGDSYLRVCDVSAAAGCDDAGAAGAGLRAVLTGAVPEFVLDYPCHSPTQRRWFRLMVSPLGDATRGGAVVMHLNVTARKLAEQALVESEERFRGTFDHAPVGISHVTPQGMFLRANQTLHQIVGFSEDELLSMSVKDIIAEQDRNRAESVRAELLSTDVTSGSAEVRCQRKDGGLVWCNLIMTPEREPDGTLRHFTCVVEDIDARKQAEMRLHRLNRLHLVLSGVGEAIIRARDRQQLYEEVCRVIVETGGLRMVAVLELDERGRAVFPVAHRGASEEYLRHLEIRLDGGPLSRGTVGTAALTGEPSVVNDFLGNPRMTPWQESAARYGLRSTASFPLWLHERTVAVLGLWASEVDYFLDDEIHLMTSVAGDLSYALSALDHETRRSEAERALRSSQKQFANAFELAPLGMALVATDGTVLRVNRALCEMLGYSENEMLALRTNEVTHPDDMAGEQRQVEELLEGRIDSFRIEKRYLHKDGQIVWALLSVSLIRDEDGRPTQFISQIQDITQQRRVQEATLMQALMLDQIGQAVIATRPDGVIVYANQFATEMYGWDKGEMLNRGVNEITRPRIPSAEARDIEAHLHRGESWSGEYYVRAKDGRTFPVFVTRSPLIDQGRLSRVIEISTDISLRRDAENALHRSEKQLRLVAQRLRQEHDRLLEAQAIAHLGSWEADFETQRIRWSEEASRIFGQPPDFLPTFSAVTPLIHPQDLARVTAAVEESLLEGSGSVEHRIIRADGNTRHIEERWQVVCDALGKPRRMAGTSQDITERRESEQQILEEHLYSQALIEHSPSAIITYKATGEGVSANPVSARVLGAPSLEAVRTQNFRRIASWQRTGILTVAEEALATGAPRETEMHTVSTFGKEIWLRIRFVPFNYRGEQYLLGIFDDILERRRSEEAVRQSERLLSIAGRLGKMGAWALDLPFMTLEWSQEVRTIHEVPEDFTVDLDVALNFYVPEDRPRISEAMRLCLVEGAPFDLELRVRTAAGRPIWVRVTGEADRDDRGSIVRVQGALQDITDQRASAEELARTNRALAMLSSGNEAVVRAEDETHLLEQVCRIAVEMGGYRMAWVGYAVRDDRKSIQPQAYAGDENGFLEEVELSWSDDTPFVNDPASRTIRSGEITICEDIAAAAESFCWQEPAVRRDYRAAICLPLRESGRTFGILTLYSGDARERQEHEIDLMRELADNLAFGIVNLRSREERRRIESAVLQLASGLSHASGAEFFARLLESLVESTGAAAAFIARLLPGEQPTARTIAAVAGGRRVEPFDFGVAGTPCEPLLELPAHEVDLESGLWAELGETRSGKAAARRLSDSGGELLGFFVVLLPEARPLSSFLSSTIGIYATRAAAELERQRAHEHMVEQASLLDQATDAILVRDLDDQIRYWSRGATRLYGWTANEALGASVFKLLHVEGDESYVGASKQVLASGEWAGEMTTRTRAGEARTVGARWTLLRDENANPRSILMINTDVTGRRKLEEQFLRAQRMESLGTLAGGIAHDLNNLLAPIVMGVSVLKRNEEREKMLAVISNIERSAKRGTDLVRQVLSFGRGVEGARVPLLLDQVVDEVESILNSTFPKNIALRRESAPALPLVHGDPTQLNQVLLNLCVNARDAMPEGGTLSIAVEVEDIDEQYVAMNHGGAAGRHVVLSVSDSGIGMKRETIDRIFDPFFTTKELGKGTGLGLSTVIGIVRSHGGFVNVYSEPGAGSTFRVYLPAVKQVATSAEAAPAADEIPRGNGELILIVDDEQPILSVTSQTLEAFGYRTMIAEDGVVALALYGSHRDEIAVVVTDMMMPVMDGPALIVALRRLKPDVRVVATSGLGSSENVARARAAGVQHFLSKPYSAERLLTSLHDLLVNR